MHCTTYQRYTNTIGWLGRSKRNHREVTYSIVQNAGKVTVAVLVDEGGERKSVRLDAAVECVVARVDAADTTPPLEEGLAGRRAYAPDVVRKRVRLRSAAPVEPYVEGYARLGLADHIVGGERRPSQRQPIPCSAACQQHGALQRHACHAIAYSGGPSVVCEEREEAWVGARVGCRPSQGIPDAPQPRPQRAEVRALG